MTILLVIHIIITSLLIGIILIQKSEGGGLGGSSSSGQTFSARGAANFLTRTTAVLATLFIGMCILMTIVSKKRVMHDSNVITQQK